MKRELQITSALLMLLLIVYIWGEYSAFKVFKNESGTSWTATGKSYNSIRHK